MSPVNANHAILAAQLWQARLTGNTVETDDFPTTTAEAYEIQSAVTEQSGCAVTGFKIGATVDATMALLGVDRPFFGPLYDRWTHVQPPESKPADYPSIAVSTKHNPKVESEFVIKLKKGLSTETEVTEAIVRDCTEWVAAGFEIIGSRFSKSPAQRGLCAIADTGSNIDFLVGVPVTDWGNMDFNAHPVSLSKNGQRAGLGDSGMSIAGNPFGMVAWLARQPELKHRGLLAGDLITCGTCTGIVDIAPGDTLLANFGELGELGANIISFADKAETVQV